VIVVVRLALVASDVGSDEAASTFLLTVGLSQSVDGRDKTALFAPDTPPAIVWSATVTGAATGTTTDGTTDFVMPTTGDVFFQHHIPA